MLERHTTDFLAYCKVAGFSKRSIKSLTASLREFNAFVGTQPVAAPRDLSYGQLADFVTDFQKPSIHKRKSRVWCLHQFFHFLVISRQIKTSIAQELPYPKIEKTVPQFLTGSELNRIIEHFCRKADTPVGLRNLSMILLLGLVGLRTSTIIRLNVEHINPEAALVWVREKGRRQRLLVLPCFLGELLGFYVSLLGHKAGPLFQSSRGQRISARSLQSIFKAAASQLGIDKPLHCWLFRHTAATHLNKVAGTTITQTVLGHDCRLNTLKYAHLNPDQYALYMGRHPYMREARP